MRRGPRWAHRLWARWTGYFWKPCPVCGRFFGGHEWGMYSSIPTGRPGITQAVCSYACRLKGDPCPDGCAIDVEHMHIDNYGLRP